MNQTVFSSFSNFLCHCVQYNCSYRFCDWLSIVKGGNCQQDYGEGLRSFYFSVCKLLVYCFTEQWMTTSARATWTALSVWQSVLFPMLLILSSLSLLAWYLSLFSLIDPFVYMQRNIQTGLRNLDVALHPFSSKRVWSQSLGVIQR